MRDLLTAQREPLELRSKLTPVKQNVDLEQYSCVGEVAAAASPLSLSLSLFIDVYCNFARRDG
jgi:hypothetical protein